MESDRHPKASVPNYQTIPKHRVFTFHIHVSNLSIIQLPSLYIPPHPIRKKPRENTFVPADPKFASVGLKVSGSHDLGEITCNLMMLFADILFIDIRYTH